MLPTPGGGLAFKRSDLTARKLYRDISWETDEIFAVEKELLVGGDVDDAVRERHARPVLLRAPHKHCIVEGFLRLDEPCGRALQVVKLSVN